MIDLIRSEVLKIRSTQVWFWMLVLSVGFTGLATIPAVLSAIDNHGNGQPVDYYQLFTQSQSAGIALLVLGLLGLTTEFRHKTITPTLLATPGRSRLILAKALSYAIFSLVYAAVCLAVNFAMVIIWLNAKGLPVELGHGIAGGELKVYLSLILTGMFGLGLGALIRNQAAAMVFGVVYFFLLDALLRVIPYIRLAWPYSPGGSVTALLSRNRGDAGFSDVHELSPLLGGIVFALWAAGLVILGGNLGLRRDIS
jgi:ABC-2 type transport system permease protein